MGLKEKSKLQCLERELKLRQDLERQLKRKVKQELKRELKQEVKEKLKRKFKRKLGRKLELKCKGNPITTSPLKLKQPSFKEDAKLLKTGFLSDVKVVCGDKTWQLHKYILCTRSSFFMKAFTGKFKEAETGCIEIHEQDPTEVGWVITFIYTSKAAPDLKMLLLDDDTMADTCVRLSTIGDYLSVDRLGDMVANVLYKKHVSVAHAAQRAGDTAWISDDFVSVFFQAAATAYARCRSTFGPLRQAFAKFFELSRFLALRDERFRAQLRNIPELSHDILMLLVKDEGENDGRCMVLFERPCRCFGCRREEVDFFPLAWVECGVEITLDRKTDQWDGIGPEGYCEQCARVFEKVPDAFPPIEDD
ncbi:hypothetical protein DL771_007464 [Monosporascus sp. 5C6A]|nr:hypothetical protein DL771_007464 [Monosporascus sp. 5C6A]